MGSNVIPTKEDTYCEPMEGARTFSALGLNICNVLLSKLVEWLCG